MIWKYQPGGRRRSLSASALRGFLIVATLWAGASALTTSRAQENPGAKSTPTPADARAIVDSLASLNLSNAPLSAEQAVWFKVKLASLAAHGSQALPAIREFLQRNQDIYFDAPGSAEMAGTPSLRIAMFELVGKSAGSEAVVLLKSTFAATADPVELATLAKLLERAEPGKHHAQFAAAARETLALAASEKWDGRDVAPLFELLKQFGGTSATNDLERLVNPWFHYVPITLLELPADTGAPTLIRMAQNADGKFSLGREAFLRALAQAAVRHTSAADELVTQTKADKISTAAWTGIGAALVGNTLHFAHPALAAPSPARNGGRTFRIALGNQSFFETAPPDKVPPNDLGDRIRLIDRLLDATTNPAALDALEGARIQLSEKLGRAN